MDGENKGKPYEQMDDLGVPLFLETPIFCWFFELSGRYMGDTWGLMIYDNGITGEISVISLNVATI